MSMVAIHKATCIFGLSGLGRFNQAQHKQDSASGYDYWCFHDGSRSSGLLHQCVSSAALLTPVPRHTDCLL